MFTQLKDGKFEADFTQALQKRGLAATGSNFPPANTFIPTLCRCSHPIPNTLCFLSQESCTARSSGKMQSRQLNLGQKPKAAQCRCWNMSLPMQPCIPDLPCSAPRGPSPTGGTQTRNCSLLARLRPNTQQHKHHRILLSTKHTVKYIKLLPRKKKRKTRPKHTFIPSQEAQQYHVRWQILWGAKCNFSFPLELGLGGRPWIV